MFLRALKEIIEVKNRYQVEIISDKKESSDFWKAVLMRDIIPLKFKGRSYKSGF